MIMGRTNVAMAAVGFVIVAVASLVPPVGMVLLAPLAALLAGFLAGRRLAARAEEGEPWAAARAGAAVGVGAFLGTLVAVLYTATTIGADASFRELLSTGEGSPAWLPYEWIAPLVPALGALAGLILGAVNFAAALLGGLMATTRPAALTGQRQRREPDLGLYMAMGMLFGMVFGAALGDPATGLVFGMIVGIAAHSLVQLRRRRINGNL